MSAGARLSRGRLAVSAALILGALFPASAGTHPASPPDPLAALVVQPFPGPLPAPALSLRGMDGRPLRLEDFKGRVVFLNFWATWCVPCRQEMLAMERLYRAYRNRGLAVVAVNFRESEGEIRRFVQERSLTFPVGMDPEGTGARAYGVRGLPVTYLLGGDGRILWKAIGSREWDGPASRAYFETVLQAAAPEKS